MWWEFNIVAWFYTFRDKNLVSRVAFKLKNVGALILCSFLRKCEKEVIWDIKVPAKRHLQQINFCHEGCLTSWKVYLIFTLKNTANIVLWFTVKLILNIIPQSLCLILETWYYCEWHEGFALSGLKYCQPRSSINRNWRAI